MEEGEVVAPKNVDQRRVRVWTYAKVTEERA